MKEVVVTAVLPVVKVAVVAVVNPPYSNRSETGIK
jgi:hypothetical protein